MSTPVPHNRNKVGYVISLVTHPLVIFVPTLVLVLKDADLVEAVGWVAFIALVIFSSAAILLCRVRRQGRHPYQRETRQHIYLIFWLSMVVCVVLAMALHAPQRLVFSLLALGVWVPFQSVINARFTKISIHVAVVSGITTALILMGELDTAALILAAVGVVLATAWARMVTGNHSLLQVGLGVMVSVSSVLIAFALMSIWLPL